MPELSLSLSLSLGHEAFTASLDDDSLVDESPSALLPLFLGHAGYIAQHATPDGLQTSTINSPRPPPSRATARAVPRPEIINHQRKPHPESPVVNRRRRGGRSQRTTRFRKGDKDKDKGRGGRFASANPTARQRLQRVVRARHTIPPAASLPPARPRPIRHQAQFARQIGTSPSPTW